MLVDWVTPSKYSFGCLKNYLFGVYMTDLEEREKNFEHLSEHLSHLFTLLSDYIYSAK